MSKVRALELPQNRTAKNQTVETDVFYSLGTLVGGVGAPLLFGFLIASGSRTHLGMGYLLGGLLMLAGAVCEYFIGIEAAGKSLETISSRCKAQSNSER